MEDDTREIKIEKNIFISTKDLAAIYTLNREHKVSFKMIMDVVNYNKLGCCFIDIRFLKYLWMWL